MSKKRIENYIKPALQAIENSFESKKKIPSEYNGYISSFGASLIQSGLKPTLALFENESSDSKGEKKKLTDIILNILAPKSNECSLLAYVQTQDEVLMKELIIDISIAVKLSLRTFELGKGGNNE